MDAISRLLAMMALGGLAACAPTVRNVSQPLTAPTAMRVVPFTHLALGPGNGFTAAGQTLVQNRVEWDRVWSQSFQDASPLPPLPDVDFTREMVLVATLGERTSGGFGIKVESIFETDDAYVVAIVRRTPGRCYVTDGYSHPYDAVRFPVTRKQVRYSYRDETYDCPGAGLG